MGGSARVWQGVLSENLIPGSELELALVLTKFEVPDVVIGYEVAVEASVPPSAGRIELTRASIVVGEEAGAVHVPIRRTGGTSGEVGVDYETEAGSAKAGEDFVAVSGTVTWRAGEAGVKDIEVALLDDGLVEPSEELRVRLSRPVGGVSLGRSTTEVVVEDDDLGEPGEIGFARSYWVVDEEAGEAVVTVERRGGSTGAVTVDWSAEALSAAAGEDFVPTSGMLVWEDGDATAKTVTIELLGDTEVERTELVRLALSEVTGGASLDDPSVAVLVLQDDEDPRDCAAGVTGSGALCLGDGRFLIEAEWQDPRSGDRGLGRALPDSETTGFFWFFDAANVELIVKVLDARILNGFHWVFYGGLSDVEYWVIASEPVSGAVKVYRNPPGRLQGIADTRAFPDDAPSAQPVRQTTPPGRGAPTSSLTQGPCAPDATHLCLLGDRFRVGVEWEDPRSGDRGSGLAVPNSDQTGLFWFFTEDNLELVVKVLDATSFSNRFWVFYGGLTDVGYTITVEDLQRSRQKVYVKPPGNLDGHADTDAFEAP